MEDLRKQAIIHEVLNSVKKSPIFQNSFQVPQNHEYIKPELCDVCITHDNTTPEDVVTSRDSIMDTSHVPGQVWIILTYHTTHLKLKDENDLVGSNIHHPRKSICSFQPRKLNTLRNLGRF